MLLAGFTLGIVDHLRRRFARCRGTETVKAFAPRGERLSDSPQCLTYKAALNRSFTVCSRPLVAQVYSLQSGRSLFGFARPALSRLQRVLQFLSLVPVPCCAL